ncbi:MAG: transcription antitermination factor NusB [Coriobacteriales bacterium]|jgi:N utilization substance protein B|nr:transcription antitermination factor NusB [Coriobacteriales bacterium]
MSESRGKQHQLRSSARRKALQILFQCEICGCASEQVFAEELCVEEVGIPCDFTKMLLGGVDRYAPDIDKLIARVSENWSLDRMPLVDRSILRLATFEMIYLDDVPYSVSINEAVELAKGFGGEDESSRFVNGILGRIASHLSDEAREGERACKDGKSARKKVESKREKKASHG